MSCEAIFWFRIQDSINKLYKPVRQVPSFIIGTNFSSQYISINRKSLCCKVIPADKHIELHTLRNCNGNSCEVPAHGDTKGKSLSTISVFLLI